MNKTLQHCLVQTTSKSLDNTPEAHEVQHGEDLKPTAPPRRVSDPDYDLSPMDFLLLEFKL